MNNLAMKPQMESTTDATGCHLAAPIPSNEAQRLKALHAYGVLDSEAEQAFDDIARLAAVCCEVPIALISLVDRERQWFKARIGIDAPSTPREISFCAHAILQPEKVLVVQDARQDPRFANNPVVKSDPPIIFYAGAPLVAPTGEAIGTLCIADHKARDLSAMQLRMLAGLAAQAVTQLEMRRSLMLLEAAVESQTRYVDQLERQQEELLHESSTDPLTGLGNRRAFQDRLEQEYARARAGGGAVGLMILDVDFFKRYNDSFGHPAGDEVLRLLAGIMKSSCRGNDFAARIGGEEFAVVLPGTTRESAYVIAERLRRGVQRAVWPHRAVTVSVGVALSEAGTEPVSRLTERADVALYHSKRDGRNRVTMSDAAAAA
jgi:diguanylate cyclase (GGDEF)-like protein